MCVCDMMICNWPSSHYVARTHTQINFKHLNVRAKKTRRKSHTGKILQSFFASLLLISLRWKLQQSKLVKISFYSLFFWLLLCKWVIKQINKQKNEQQIGISSYTFPSYMLRFHLICMERQRDRQTQIIERVLRNCSVSKCKKWTK